MLAEHVFLANAAELGFIKTLVAGFKNVQVRAYTDDMDSEVFEVQTPNRFIKSYLVHEIQQRRQQVAQLQQLVS